VNENNEKVETTVDELNGYPVCLLRGRPACCPYPSLSNFWKVALGVNALLMLVFALTLWLMSASIVRYAELEKERDLAEIAVLSKVQEGLHHSQQLTMENRSVQTEIKGMILTLQKLLEDRYGQGSSDNRKGRR